MKGYLHVRYIIKQSPVAVNVITVNESYAVVQILFCYNFYISLPFTAITNNEAQKRGITLCTKDKSIQIYQRKLENEYWCIYDNIEI